MPLVRLAAGLSAIALALALSTRSESVDLWRFPISWCGVVLALDGAVRLRHGRSPLRARNLLFLSAASVLFWDIFELLNLRLRNWWYVGVPRSFLGGAAFSALSFATVLPAGRLLFALLTPRDRDREPDHDPDHDRDRNRNAHLDSGREGDRVGKARAGRPGRLALIGLLALLLALAFPRYAFPLAWIFLWPLCEALLLIGGPCSREPGAFRSPLEALRQGDRGTFARFLLCAPVMGLLWEALNSGSARGWVYTVPFFEEHKLFEMPLPGYLGYLPFLLEVGAALALCDLLAARLRGFGMALAICALAIAHVGAERLGRGSTVISMAPRIADAETVSPDLLAHLHRRGIATPRDVLNRGGPEVPEEVRLLSELATIKGMGIRWAERLRAAGVLGVSGLSREDPGALFARLRAQGQPPPPALVRLWVRAAKAAAGSRSERSVSG